MLTTSAMDGSAVGPSFPLGVSLSDIHRTSVCANDHERCSAPPTNAQSTEMRLLARARSGDHDAFYELARPHQRGAFVVALSILGNEADAEEAAQEAILKAFQYLGSFRSEARFSTWLIQIAVNEARMKVRRYRRHLYESIDAGRRMADGTHMPYDFVDPRAIPAEALFRKELRQALALAMQSLPEKYRVVLVLRDVQQLTSSETARALGISESNVKMRLLRARRQMRAALAPTIARRHCKGRCARDRHVTAKNGW